MLTCSGLSIAGGRRGVLVVGGERRVERAPLGPDGADPWAVTLDNHRVSALALTRDGDDIAAGADIAAPYAVRLHRLAANGTLLWSHAVPGLSSPRQLAVTPGDESSSSGTSNPDGSKPASDTKADRPDADFTARADAVEAANYPLDGPTTT